MWLNKGKLPDFVISSANIAGKYIYTKRQDIQSKSQMHQYIVCQNRRNHVSPSAQRDFFYYSCFI